MNSTSCKEFPHTDLSETYVWGVILGLLGSIAINTGNNIQSLGMKQLEDIARNEAKERNEIFDPHNYKEDNCSSKVWIFGTTIFLSGSLLNFGSYSLAPQSVLACLEAIQFVTNILFAKFMFGTSLIPRWMVGTVLVIAGILTVIIAMSQCCSSDSLFAVWELQEFYSNTAYIIYLITIVVGGVLTQLVHLNYQAMKDKGMPKPNSDIVLPVTYAVFSALFGTQSVVQIKCVAAMLNLFLMGDKKCEKFRCEHPHPKPDKYETVCGDEIFSHWFFWMSLILWIAFVVVWLYRLNEALSKYNPLFIIPLLQSNFIFFAVVSGGIYFQEFDVNFFGSGYGWSCFLGGCMVSFYGIYLLRPEHHPQAKIVPEKEDYSQRSLDVGGGQQRNSPGQTNGDARGPKISGEANGAANDSTIKSEGDSLEDFEAPKQSQPGTQ